VAGAKTGKHKFKISWEKILDLGSPVNASAH